LPPLLGRVDVDRRLVQAAVAVHAEAAAEEALIELLSDRADLLLRRRLRLGQLQGQDAQEVLQVLAEPIDLPLLQEGVAVDAAVADRLERRLEVRLLYCPDQKVGKLNDLFVGVFEDISQVTDDQ